MARGRALSPAELIALRFVLDERGRILRTNEPAPQPGPRLTLIRSGSEVAWAVRADVDERGIAGGVSDEGPTYAFPEVLPASEARLITSLEPLQRYLVGWTAEEIPGCQPMLAICDGEDAVSVCFSARLSATAAEAGVYTSTAHRGRGYAAIVTAAWAEAVRASGRTPVYSTSFTNTASLAVARKLGLVACATQLNVLDPA